MISIYSPPFVSYLFPGGCQLLVLGRTADGDAHASGLAMVTILSPRDV